MAKDTRMNDPNFDRTFSLREIHRIMHPLIKDHDSLGEVTKFDLLDHLFILLDGQTEDPGTAGDYRAAVDIILDDPKSANLDNNGMQATIHIPSTSDAYSLTEAKGVCG